MALTAPVRPIDRLLAGCNLALAGAWLVAGDPGAPAAAALHLAALAVPAALDRLATRAPRPATVAREAWPLVLLFTFWSELGPLLPRLHPVANDAFIARLDLALFGRHWNTEWAALMPWPWLTETMFFAYLLYLPLIVAPVAALALRGRLDAVGDASFRLMATYAACYAVYLVFPVLGPRESLPGAEALVPGGFFAGISELLRDHGDSLGTAFPSSHAAGAVTVAIVAARWFRPATAALLAAQAALVALATVYTGNHFTIDAVAGVGLAALAQLALVPWLLARFAPRPAPRVPLLPRFVPGARP
jgi:membrane-associated phospholipid phosphatase